MNIRLTLDPYEMNYALRIFERGAKGCYVTAEPLILTKHDRGDTPLVEPVTTFMRKEEFQDLMDDLWSMGLRPSARSDEYKAQLGSMRDHLNDMRTIVFKKREDLKG